jgi:hypothetical protein
MRRWEECDLATPLTRRPLQDRVQLHLGRVLLLALFALILHYSPLPLPILLFHPRPLLPRDALTSAAAAAATATASLPLRRAADAHHLAGALRSERRLELRVFLCRVLRQLLVVRVNVNVAVTVRVPVGNSERPPRCVGVCATTAAAPQPAPPRLPRGVCLLERTHRLAVKLLHRAVRCRGPCAAVHQEQDNHRERDYGEADAALGDHLGVQRAA